MNYNYIEAIYMNNIYDLIIIGSGPGGLSTGIYSGRAKLKTLIIEKKTFGGQILNTGRLLSPDRNER